MSSPTDEEYTEGIYATERDWQRPSCWLQSLTPRQELACRLVQRAYCRVGNGQFKQGINGFVHVAALWPENRLCKGAIQASLNRWKRKLKTFGPPVPPRFHIAFPPRRWPHLSIQMERDIIAFEILEKVQAEFRLPDNTYRPMPMEFHVQVEK
jgi:hypothetical protein